MLTLKCAACKTKLFKYRKIGQGEVLRCHKDRIARRFEARFGDTLACPCGNEIGRDMGGHYKMIQDRFVYSGTKDNK